MMNRKAANIEKNYNDLEFISEVFNFVRPLIEHGDMDWPKCFYDQDYIGSYATWPDVIKILENIQKITEKN